MANSSCATKRAKLRASKVKWSKVGEHSEPITGAGYLRQDSVRQWLISGCGDDALVELSLETAAPLRRHASSEDDLALGVEAALYGKQTNLGSVQEFLRVMDVLNLWHDDPEELLLDLGFGCDEPDIAVKIPSRFINHPSQARGINIQVFLEAQKNRIDVENPDLSNRFRQLEVLQQVTTAFSSLVAPQPAGPPSSDQPSAEARERRKRLGMLLRRASRKTLSQMASVQEPRSEPQAGPCLKPRPELYPELSREPGRDLCTELRNDPRPECQLEARPEIQTESCPELRLEPRPEPRPLLKRARQFRLPEGSILSPLVEEQGPQLRTSLEMEARCATAIVMSRKRDPGEKHEPESFELEEIQSFDEGSVAGSVSGPADGGGNGESGVVRTNSCQSDSSGFLEEPVVPSLRQMGSAAPELMKALYAMSEDTTDSQDTVKNSLDLPSPASRFPRVVESEVSDTPSSTGTQQESETSTNPGVPSRGADADLSPQEDTCLQGTHLAASAEDGMDRDTRSHSFTEVEPEAKLVEETAFLVEDSTRRGLPQQVCEEVPPIEAQWEGPPDSKLATGPIEEMEQGPRETTFARSLSDSKVVVADPSPTCRGTDTSTMGSSRGKPDWLGTRSVSVQMPSSLTFVSHKISGRWTPPTTQSRKGSLCRRAWSDHERPHSTDFEGKTIPTATVTLPQQRSWHDGPGSKGSFRTRSTSLDTGLAHEDEEEETGDERWEEDAEEDEGSCCCRCHHRCSCCPPQTLHRRCSRWGLCSRDKRPSVEIPEQDKDRFATFPYSVDELDGMMRCTRVFRTVLVDLEQRLGEEQASLYRELTEEERAEVRLVQELRSTVRKEATELELQLAELAHHYDQGFKSKMHRLLDEQSYLCSQLRLRPLEPQVWSPAPSLSTISMLSPARAVKTRTVATQCSLLPWPPQGSREFLFHGQRPKADRILGEKQSKLDFVVFLQSLREPLQHSFPRDPLK